MKMPEKEKEKKPVFKKILIDTQPPRSGTCVYHNFLYALLGVGGALYVAFILDRNSFEQYSKQYSYLGYVQTVFSAIEEYSPFHQFMETDQEFIDRMKKLKPESAASPSTNTKSGVRIFSKDELSKYDGSDGSTGIYLALLGQVYDVSKGKDYYGPGGGYAFFSGKDGSRAFVTGQFDEAGLIEDVTGLSNSDYLGLKQWEDFYAKDYSKVGLLEGRFYNKDGDVTEDWKQLQASISLAMQDQDKQDVEKKVFPPCNVEWTKEKGSRFWCTAKSGGVARTWVGVPRKLFYPGRDERCACVRDTGSPTTDPSSPSTRGDLDNPHLKEYTDCPPASFECWNKKN